MNLGITELLIILAIVVLLFGTKKLKNMGGDLGSAIRSFRSAVKDEGAAEAPTGTTPAGPEAEKPDGGKAA